MPWITVAVVLTLIGFIAFSLGARRRRQQRLCYDSKVGLTRDELAQLLPPGLRDREYQRFEVAPSDDPIRVGLIYDDGKVRRGNPANVGLDFDADTGSLLRIHEDGVGLGQK